MWVGRIVVLVVAACAFFLATGPNTGSIMDLVTNAWGVFGASFGPTILLSLFWRRFSFAGAVAGIVTGAVVDIAWIFFMSQTGIYELAPGFLAGLTAAVVVSFLTRPNAEVQKLFDEAVNVEPF